MWQRPCNGYVDLLLVVLVVTLAVDYVYIISIVNCCFMAF